MTGQGEDSASRLAWGVRSYLRLVVVVLVVAMAAAIWPHPSARYRASALVTAYTLQMNPLQLPRLGQTVFANGAVADAVIANQHLSVKRDKVIPAKVSLAPAQDSIIFVVHGTDKTPAVAAALANAAADAFAGELNKPGAGLGRFGVQERAAVPVKPISSGRGLAVRTLIGGAGGLALALGLVALLLMRRRPIIDLAEAAGLCGAEPLGTLCLANPKRKGDAAERAAGISPLIRALGPELGATWTFVACGDGAEPAAAERLRGLVTAMIGASGEVLVVADAADALEEPAPVRATAATRRGARRPLVARPHMVVKTAGRAPEVFDALRGPAPEDRTVLVVCDGTPAARAAEVASDFLPDDVTGVVFVRRSPLRSRVRPRLWTGTHAGDSRAPHLHNVAPLAVVTSDASTSPADRADVGS